jgi:hypothetical protein
MESRIRKTRKAAGVLAACAALTTGVAVAHTEVFPTKLTIGSVGSGTTSSGFVGSVDGDLSSSNPKCLPNRTVKLFFNDSGTSTLVDVDRSSSNGAWGVRGHAASEPDTYTVRVIRRRIDRSLGSAHRHICGRNKITSAFIHFPGP